MGFIGMGYYVPELSLLDNPNPVIFSVWICWHSDFIWALHRVGIRSFNWCVSYFGI